MCIFFRTFAAKIKIITHLDAMKTIFIGKNAENDYVINAPTVSRKHAVLTVDDNGIVSIKDLNSTNGTYVNGERVTQKTLHEGDIVTVAKDQVVDWTRFVTQGKKKGGVWNRKIASIVIGVLVLIVAGAACYLLLGKNKGLEAAALEEPAQPLTTAQIYEKYGSAVCIIAGEYSYTVSIDWKEDESMVWEAYSALQINESMTFSVNSYGYVTLGGTSYTGTGFFISADGKMGTNLHIVKPWLFYPEQAEILLQSVQAELAQYAETEEDPRFRALIQHVKVTPHLDKLAVHPNGLPVSETNLTECVVYSAGDDPDKDVAIIQTVTHSLPNGVNAYIDIKDAELDESALSQGKYVCLIGFPHGTDVAAIEKGKGDYIVLENQIQSGEVTQNRGDIEFGHNAPSYSGASGSPVLNEYGHLVGVHHAGWEGSHGFNLAIKAVHLVNLNK